jgi:MFS family permease
VIRASIVLRRARVGVGAAFAAHGVISGSWGPRLPAIKANIGLDDGELGLALTGFAAGMLLGTRVARRPVERFGSRAVVRLVTPVFAATLVGPGVAGSVGSLAAALFALGLAGGLLDVANNSNAVDVERAHRRPMMSSIHATWSIGMLAGAGVAAAAAALGVGVGGQLTIVAIAVALATIAPLDGLMGAEHRPSGSGDHPSRIGGSVVVIALLGLVGFGSFLVEGAAADWSAVYLHEHADVGLGTAAIAFVAFSLGMACARLAGDGLTARFGPVAMVRSGGIVAALALGAGLALGGTGTSIVGFAVLGLALGPVVPIVFSAAGNAPESRPGATLAWVVTFGYLGSILGPVAIGLTAEAATLRAALFIPVVFGVVIATAAGVVRARGGPLDVEG